MARLDDVESVRESEPQAEMVLWLKTGQDRHQGPTQVPSIKWNGFLLPKLRFLSIIPIKQTKQQESTLLSSGTGGLVKKFFCDKACKKNTETDMLTGLAGVRLTDTSPRCGQAGPLLC